MKKVPKQLDWIAEGEKYALIGLEVSVDKETKHGEVAPNLWVLAKPQFQMPEHWKEWLGTIRIENIEATNLYLIAKQRSERVDVLDDENNRLKQLVSQFYTGLLLSSRFSPSHKPFILSGSFRRGEVDVREFGEFEVPTPRAFGGYPQLGSADIELGVRLGNAIGKFVNSSVGNAKSRYSRVLNIYHTARTTDDLLYRIHQFTRCIEGLIAAKAGQTKRQLKSRTELFIGPHHHGMMDEIYEIRSAIEHLNESKYIGEFDREMRLDLIRKEAVVECIARKAIRRVVERESLWPFFISAGSVSDFWKLSVDQRETLWGERIDPLAVLLDFDPTHIHDGQLGREW